MFHTALHGRSKEHGESWSYYFPILSCVLLTYWLAIILSAQCPQAMGNACSLFPASWPAWPTVGALLADKKKLVSEMAQNRWSRPGLSFCWSTAMWRWTDAFLPRSKSNPENKFLYLLPHQHASITNTWILFLAGTHRIMHAMLFRTQLFASATWINNFMFCHIWYTYQWVDAVLHMITA